MKANKYSVFSIKIQDSLYLLFRRLSTIVKSKWHKVSSMAKAGKGIITRATERTPQTANIFIWLVLMWRYFSKKRPRNSITYNLMSRAKMSTSRSQPMFKPYSNSCSSIKQSYLFHSLHSPESRMVSDRRLGIDRRRFCYTACIPERRGNSDRRSSRFPET